MTKIKANKLFYEFALELQETFKDSIKIVYKNEKLNSINFIFGDAPEIERFYLEPIPLIHFQGGCRKKQNNYFVWLSYTNSLPGVNYNTYKEFYLGSKKLNSNIFQYLNKQIKTISSKIDRITKIFNSRNPQL